MWRGSFGRDMPEVTTITRIEVTAQPRTKAGSSTKEVSWDLVRANRVIVDLATGNWAYGEQISPYEEPKAKTTSEQIQEDIITFMGDKNTLIGDRNQVEWLTDQLCQIVVDNFAFAKQS